MRIPKADAVGEMVRRRRAAGGPAESAFATLVGLELRPRRLREAAAFWRRVTEEAGAEARDGLWAHPDIMPTGADVDDPSTVIRTLTGGAAEPDAMDRAISDLLAGGDDRPIEGAPGDAPDEPNRPDEPTA